MGGKPSCCAPTSASKLGELVTKTSKEATEAEEQVPLTQQMKILYIERSSDCDSTAPSSKSTATVAARTLGLVQAIGNSSLAILPNKLDKSLLHDFRDCLTKAGIDISVWGVKGTKTVEHLYWETFVQKGCLITHQKDGTLKRVTRIVKIRIVADIFGVEHVLQSRLQFMHDGQCIERKQVLVKRLCWNGVQQEEFSRPGQPVPFNESYSSQHTPACEGWRMAVKSALKDRLGMSMKLQEQHLEEELHSYNYRVEDNQSGGFPGLNTLYCIHEITLRIVNAEATAMHCLGLPAGQEFATTEGDFNLSQQMQSDDDTGLPLGTQLNIWTWVRVSGAPSSPSKSEPREVKSPKQPASSSSSSSAPPPGCGEAILIKRAPIPDASVKYMARIQSMLAVNGCAEAEPSSMLHLAQKGRETNWEQARRMAKSIADSTYSLRDFTSDLQAFPELDLYLLDGSHANLGHSVSGRTLGDEFQRTIGAFYAIYWLMRLRGDGKDGFSFGVDDDWQPIRHGEEASNEKNLQRMYPAEKRLKFYHESSWSNFEQLLVDAEMLKRDGRNLKVNEDRVLTILALTAIHDIMKVQALLPKVQPEHAPYHGYVAGDTISDHDHALSYLMDHYPELLPSFNGLDEKDRCSVAFTQCRFQFNHGWFVQAEAPPGAIFTEFRDLLIRDQQSQVKPRDIALYFVHWLTDLAGAEPTPLGGCERFVIKFPLPVLNSFLRSFGFVEKIAHKTETQVMEEYLKMRWKEHTPCLGPLPTGECAIARMRLICMAQTNSNKVLAGFDELPADDKEILNIEMARTGCMGQSYSADLIPADLQNEPMGPALLIYYGPAFLQSLGSDNACKRLIVLAEVYRAARSLWPLKVAQVGTTVTVRIDTIKTLSTSDILDAMKHGKVWVMVKHNELEAFVEHSSTTKLNKFISNGQALHVLDLPHS